MNDLHQCPRCNGEGHYMVVTSVDFSPRSWDCEVCGGKGFVPQEKLLWIQEGKEHREERVSSGNTLRYRAELYGVAPIELSNFEKGAATNSREKIRAEWPKERIQE